MRRLALTSGAMLVAAAFFAGTHVADTREGLIFEVVTLMAGLAGVTLLLYGLLANPRRAQRATDVPVKHEAVPSKPRVRSANELLIGSGGLIVSGLLIAGLAFSAGTLWAVLGMILLLPMVIGSGYFCFLFIRGPQRDWRIDVQRLTGHR